MPRAVPIVRMPDRLGFAFVFLGLSEGERSNPVILNIRKMFIEKGVEKEHIERISFFPLEAKRNADGSQWVWTGIIPGFTSTQQPHRVQVECCFEAGTGTLTYLEEEEP